MPAKGGYDKWLREAAQVCPAGPFGRCRGAEVLWLARARTRQEAAAGAGDPACCRARERTTDARSGVGGQAGLVFVRAQALIPLL